MLSTLVLYFAAFLVGSVQASGGGAAVPDYILRCLPASPSDAPTSESCLATVAIIPAGERFCVGPHQVRRLEYSLGDCAIELFDDTDCSEEEQFCIDQLRLQSVVERTVFACEDRDSWVIRGELAEEEGKRGVRLVKAGVEGEKKGWVFW